ncbi:hypothetical protein [Chelativorans sp. YIM 93263]|nr:hypothetical protein [Chelativorans sp. YIM 93263]
MADIIPSVVGVSARALIERAVDNPTRPLRGHLPLKGEGSAPLDKEG